MNEETDWITEKKNSPWIPWLKRWLRTEEGKRRIQQLARGGQAPAEEPSARPETHETKETKDVTGREAHLPNRPAQLDQEGAEANERGAEL